MGERVYLGGHWKVVGQRSCTRRTWGQWAGGQWVGDNGLSGHMGREQWAGGQWVGDNGLWGHNGIWGAVAVGTVHNPPTSIHNRPMIYEPHPQHAPITPNHPPCDRGAIYKPVPPMPVGKPITRPTAPSSAQRPRYRHRRCYWRRARRCPPARHP